MSVYQIDPMLDARWTEFVRAHPKASVFHTSSWLKALQRTYGYQPVAFTTSPPTAELKDAIVFCRVESWLTGKRLVSIPFADHCSPLVSRAEDLYELVDCVAETEGKHLKYVEIRPLSDGNVRLAENTSLREHGQFRIHFLDVRRDVNVIFKSFHKSSVQRRIGRAAERRDLVYESGSSRNLLQKFYYLLVQTSRRHGVPPQPIRWYENLLSIFEERVRIRVASISDVPIASILTLSHNGTVTYKYGCSDKEYHRLGGMAFLLWRAIVEAKESGANTFDMGRSDPHHTGLIHFKANWGTVDSPLSYWRYPARDHWSDRFRLKVPGVASYILAKAPGRLAIDLGRVLYKHAG